MRVNHAAAMFILAQLIRTAHGFQGGLTKMNAEEAAIALETALTSMDSKAIVDILTETGNSRRMEIVEAYKKKISRGKRTTFGITTKKFKLNFAKVIRSMTISLPSFLARELHEAITSIRVDRDAILEILCGQSNNNIKLTTSEYELIFGCSLEMDLLGMETQGDFKSFCIALTLDVRASETTKVNENLVKNDAIALYNAGEGRYWWSDDENESAAAVELAVWIAIFTQRSQKHLLQVFPAYNDLTKTPIEEAIKKQFSGNVRIGFLTLVSCIKDKANYFAERLHCSMKGFGTDNNTLIRVVVSNADVGFSDIKRIFKENYNGTLEKWIAGDTSGDYKNILLSIVSPDQDTGKESDNNKEKPS